MGRHYQAVHNNWIVANVEQSLEWFPDVELLLAVFRGREISRAGGGSGDHLKRATLSSFGQKIEGSSHALSPGGGDTPC